MDYRKLKLVEVKKCLEERLQYHSRDAILAELRQLQIAVYVMIGGGLLGSFAANQPWDFYIDDRVGRLPYSKRAIIQAVSILNLYREVLGINHNDYPKLAFDAHNCGVF